MAGREVHALVCNVLVTLKGKRTTDFEDLFANTLSDIEKANFDGLTDPNNLPFEQEPEKVRQDLMTVRK